MDDRTTLLSELSESIVRALAYYDLFDHPLTSLEIYSNLPTNHITPLEIEKELRILENRALIFRLGDFYSLRNNPDMEIRRRAGNTLAKKYMPIAVAKANFIGQFPFVRSVMISGSLSKGYADDQSDIDFFIITKPGRLWIARTFLVMYKRLFLFNSHKYFCVNYFVDTEHLQIEEKNIFTATELATLIPLYGSGYHKKLLQQNEWLHQFFPNFRSCPAPDTTPAVRGLKKVAEWILDFCFPGLLDRFFMRLTLRRWKKMYGHTFPAADFGIAFKTDRHVSKNHPKNYQRQIVSRYEKRIQSFHKYFAMNSLV